MVYLFKNFLTFGLSALLQATSSCPPGHFEIYEICAGQCTAGVRNNTCSICPSGQYAPSGSIVCSNCSFGSSSSKGASECVASDPHLTATRTRDAWLWLESERNFASSRMAFSVVSSTITAENRLPLLKLWWLPGLVGCVSLDSTLPEVIEFASKMLLPGLKICAVPNRFNSSSLWMKDGSHDHALHRGVVQLLPSFIFTIFIL